MSVQIELPPTPAACSTSKPRSSSSYFSRRAEAAAAGRKRSSQDSMLSEQRQQRQHSSHSTCSAVVPGSSAVALRRESLKLSFNRSISEPHAPGVSGVPAGNGGSGIDPPVLSPPSVSPSLHPSKRSRMDQQKVPTPTTKCEIISEMSPPAAACSSSSAVAVAPSSTAAPGCFLRPPPQGLVTPAGTVSLPASPCSESSTLQRTLLLQHASTTDHDRLAARLELRGSNNNKEDFLLVDCRPFIAFNVNHIRGAINVNCCDRFNRKRLQQGKATLADLATTKEGKELLKRRTWREVVVYDDCSDSLETLPVSHTLFLVMNALVEDHREPVMLLGGLRDFQVSHRALCADHLMRNGGGGGGLSPNSPMNPSDRLSFGPALPPSPSELCNTTKDIENHPATQVLPYLYLGNMRDAADSGVLRRLGVKYVLNVTAKPPNYRFEPGVVYKQLEAADNGIQVSHTTLIYPIFWPITAMHR